MPEAPATRQIGPVTVFFGEKSGRYPDGNQVVVRGSDTLAIFDTPQVANHIGTALDAADLVILGHVHEDHMAGLHRLSRAQVMVHEVDLDAARSWQGLSRHYGYPQTVLDELRRQIEVDFHYRPRPDAAGYADGAVWELGGVRVRAVHLPGHTEPIAGDGAQPDGKRYISAVTLKQMTSDQLGAQVTRTALYLPGPGYGFGLGFAVRLQPAAKGKDSAVGGYYRGGAGDTCMRVDTANDLFVVYMMQSPKQRVAHRAALRERVYRTATDAQLAANQ